MPTDQPEGTLDRKLFSLLAAFWQSVEGRGREFISKHEACLTWLTNGKQNWRWS